MAERGFDTLLGSKNGNTMNTIAKQDLQEQFAYKILQSTKLNLTYGELCLTKGALSEFVSNNFVHVSSRDYVTKIKVSSFLYTAFNLFQRLLKLQLKYKDRYKISFNATELAVIQHALSDCIDLHDNMSARLLYGKIHQQTL